MKREDYRLVELAKVRPGDKFPNVGYVRRMTALLNQPKPKDK